MDQFRVWEYDYPYNCVDLLVIPGESTWLPDVAQMNSEGRYSLMTMAGERCEYSITAIHITAQVGLLISFAISTCHCSHLIRRLVD